MVTIHIHSAYVLKNVIPAPAKAPCKGTTYKDKERGDVGILCWGHHHLPPPPHRWGLLWRPETATPILRAGSSSQPGPGPPHPGTQWRNGKSALLLQMSQSWGTYLWLHLVISGPQCLPTGWNKGWMDGWTSRWTDGWMPNLPTVSPESH